MVTGLGLEPGVAGLLEARPREDKGGSGGGLRGEGRGAEGSER